MKSFLMGVTLAAAFVISISGCASTSSLYADSGDTGSTVDGGSSSQVGGAQTEADAPSPAQEEPAAPAPTSFDVGSDFNQNCSVAWPSAPIVTTSAIQLTLSCGGVPSTYPLVVAIYPDPNLPVTPSTGQMNVVGSIVDIGKSESGLVFLIVRATAVTF